MWAPHLFEFNVTSWLLIGVYLLALFACANRVRLEAHAVRFWFFASIVVGLFLFFRVFNLAEIATLAGRCDALSGDWYQERRPYQLTVVIMIAVAAMAAAILAIMRLKGLDRKTAGAALSALAFLLAVKSISFHALDSFMGLRLFSGHMNGAIEAGLLALLIFAALNPKRRY